MEKNKLMMIIIIVLLVILLASVGVVTFFAFKMLSNSDNPEEGEGSTPTVSEPAMLTPDQMTTYSLAKPIATNLADGPDGKKHVIHSGITIAVNATDLKDKEYIKLTTETLPGNEKIISSLCIDIFRSKTFEEISMIGSKEQLQDEILSKLQEVFNTNLIVAVYLDEMLQQ